MKKDEWQEHSRQTRPKLHMPLVAQPWTSHPERRMHGVARLMRNRDVVDVSWWRWFLQSGLELKQAKKVDKPEWYCDISQGVQFPASEPTVPTVLQGSAIYSFQTDALMSAKELAAIMGLPHSDAVSVANLAGLVGEALHGAVLASVFCALIWIPGMPWLEEGHGHRHGTLPQLHVPPPAAQPQNNSCDRQATQAAQAELPEVEVPKVSGVLESESDGSTSSDDEECVEESKDDEEKLAEETEDDDTSKAVAPQSYNFGYESIPGSDGSSNVEQFGEMLFLPGCVCFCFISLASIQS